MTNTAAIKNATELGGEVLTDPFYFSKIFEEMSDELCRWFEGAQVTALDDFCGEMPIDQILYWYGDRMSDDERFWLENFIERWHETLSRAEREQICSDCRAYTIAANLKLVGGALRCRECATKFSAALKKVMQPGLFAF